MNQTPPASGYAPLSGIELYYEVRGEGRPVVLLHGSFGAIELFTEQAEVLLAHGRQVIGVDLQAHGRTLAVERPMRFETMADDIAGLISFLGLEQADVLGFSLGGGVALRIAIQHPAKVGRPVLVSTPCRRSGWYPEMVAGMAQIGPQFAEMMMRTPMYELYARLAPRVEDWPLLATQIGDLLRLDYDWSAEVTGLPMPVMLALGDADGLSPAHAVAFFELLGGGLRDASWDGSGMTHHRLAVLPGKTHYDILDGPALLAAVAPFLDAA